MNINKSKKTFAFLSFSRLDTNGLHYFWAIIPCRLISKCQARFASSCQGINNSCHHIQITASMLLIPIYERIPSKWNNST